MTQGVKQTLVSTSNLISSETSPDAKPALSAQEMTLAESKKRYVLFLVAIVLLLSGVAVNIIYLNDFLLRSVGLTLVLVGVGLIKASNVLGLIGLRATNDSFATTVERKGPGPLAWAVAIASAAGLVVLYLCMLQSDRAGGHDVWPVYAFGLCAFVATLAVGYFAAKWF
jgi:hypothetical protein